MLKRRLTCEQLVADKAFSRVNAHDNEDFSYALVLHLGSDPFERVIELIPCSPVRFWETLRTARD
jgi:hypothetical protein